MRYCEPKRELHRYAQWNSADDIDDVAELLGRDRLKLISEEGSGLELYYRQSVFGNVHIPRGYYIVAYGGIAGGKDIIHPDIFKKRFTEVRHD